MALESQYKWSNVSTLSSGREATGYCPWLGLPFSPFFHCHSKTLDCMTERASGLAYILRSCILKQKNAD